VNTGVGRAGETWRAVIAIIHRTSFHGLSVAKESLDCEARVSQGLTCQKITQKNTSRHAVMGNGTV
jgi:hypothetical protein